MKNVLAILIMCVTTLGLVGVIMLYSSTMHQPSLARVHQQLACLGIGAVCCLIAAWIDYRLLERAGLPFILYGVAVVLLILVLIPGVGVRVNGASRWLSVGGQPSELAKLALILAIAHHGARHQPRMHEGKVGFLVPAAMAGVPVLLVFLEPDWGTSALMATVAGVLLILAGARWWQVGGAATLGVTLMTVLLLHDPVRLPRLLVFLDPEPHQRGAGWQIWQSMLSFGNGGLLGCFFGGGSHKFGLVPEQHTDFIFSLIGEETGFVGANLVLLLFVGVVACGLVIASRAEDGFGRLLAAGISFLIGLEAVVNMGVTTGAFPNKGFPLPFISYGGSNLICMCVGVGLLASVALHSQQRAQGAGGGGRKARAGTASSDIRERGGTGQL